MTALALSISGLGRRLRQIDRVWLALALALIIGLLLVPKETLYSLGFTAEALLSVAPFLALAVAVAAGAKATGADNLIAIAFKSQGARAIFVAALFGALSPFCSCGVIPVIAALLAMGVPLPPVMAFWLASPIMDPEVFFLTAGPLGLTFAVGKTFAAIFIGLLGGFATHALMRAGGISNPLKAEVGAGCGTGCGTGCETTKVGDDEVKWRFWDERDRRQVFARESLATLAFLGKWLTLAFVLESLMLAYVPPETVTGLLGGDNPFVIPLAALIGMPAYLNSFAAIPLMSGMIDLGMQPGAAMAFMTAGAVSSIPAAIAVFALVRLPVFFWYLGLAAVGSVAIGYAYQLAVV